MLVHICIYVHIHIYLNICTYIYVYIYICIDTCVIINLSLYVFQCVVFVAKVWQAKTIQTSMVTQFWKRRLGPTKTNQTLNESWHWLTEKTLKHAKPTITEQISNPPMHIRNSDVRKPLWAETHEQKPSRHIRPDNLNHRISSHGAGGGGIKADHKLSRIISWGSLFRGGNKA